MLPIGDSTSLFWENAVQFSHPASEVGDACGQGSQLSKYVLVSLPGAVGKQLQSVWLSWRFCQCIHCYFRGTLEPS